MRTSLAFSEDETKIVPMKDLEVGDVFLTESNCLCVVTYTRYFAYGIAFLLRAVWVYNPGAIIFENPEELVLVKLSDSLIP
jgi:hypothetical protein